MSASDETPILARMGMRRTTTTSVLLVGLSAIGVWAIVHRDAGRSSIAPPGRAIDSGSGVSTRTTPMDVAVTTNGDTPDLSAGSPARVVSRTEDGNDRAPSGNTGSPASRRESSPDDRATSASSRIDTEHPPIGSAPRVRAGELYGWVVCGENGDPVPSAQIAITAWEEGAIPARIRVVSDESGGFDFGKIATHHVQLRVTHRDFLPATLHDIAITGEPIEVQLSSGGVVEGMVYDKDGSPLPRAFIRVLSSSGAMIKGERADENGAYRVSALRSGSYELVVTSRDSRRSEADGDDPAESKSELARARVEVESGNPVTLDLELQGG
ncbi:MAG: carboxypeptidase regulatory-like domain-containing protein [Planctomycetes bacterium]|nr:carboxypeptidase regulatory-like domain-containing protein [Planctomycetota bacterium]